MPLTGDTKGLFLLAESLEDVGRTGFRRAGEAAREEVDVQYLDGFKTRSDPWGSAWAPGAEGGGDLYESGNLASAQASHAGGTIRMRPAGYWVFHQLGANNMKKRAVLPFAASTWDNPIEEAIEDAMLGELPP